MKQTEVTNFAKGGNLFASLCKIGYFPHRISGIFLFEIKILLYKFLEHLPCDNLFFQIFFHDNYAHHHASNKHPSKL